MKVRENYGMSIQISYDFHAIFIVTSHRSKNNIEMALMELLGQYTAYSLSVSAMEILFSSGDPIN